MPKLSLYTTTKGNNYRYLDRIISQQYTVGGTDLYIHKYLGPANTGPSTDATQPQITSPDPTKIQDLLFLENRDRVYDSSIYRLRGHYNVQNLDFDLSQFGLFLNNDIIFITVHYNDMIDIFGRKLMTGDVIELPHLLDYDPLDTTLPSLKRFYQITDANYASEGFSPTWYPHLWRIKCEKLVNSEEFSDILSQPVQQDNYLGDFDTTKTYPAGYTVTYAGVVYQSTTSVPAGVTPPNAAYWSVVENGSLIDILTTYNKNIAINDAQLQEAQNVLPKSGYDNSILYVVPTYESTGEPAPPVGLSINSANTTDPVTGQVIIINNALYKSSAAGIRISKAALASIWDMTVDGGISDKIDKFCQTQLSIIESAPTKIGRGSGSVETVKTLNVLSLGNITGPYGTADNTYATSDQDPTLPNFSGDVTTNMDYRADCIPGFQYITRATPQSFGYVAGYLTGDGTAPNGIPLNGTGIGANGESLSGSGISFPQNPNLGDYFLRIDYFPQILYRWDGKAWVRVSENVRTQTGFGSADNQSQLNSFINNPNKIHLNSTDTDVPEAQALSSILRVKPDN